MRLLFAVIYDLVAVVFALLLAPLRLLMRRRRWLAVEISGELAWRAGRARWRPGRTPRPLAARSLLALAEQLEKAAADPRILGIVVKVEGYEGAGARLEAVREALGRFAAAGKQVVFYGRAVTMREYALMSTGRVLLAPGGRIDLKGYAADLFVLGETLSRIGVQGQFLRRAQYKTAPELFTDREVSPAQRETTQAILDELFERAVQAISKGRGRSPEEVRAWIDEGPFTAARALQKGLVDGIADGEEIEQQLAEMGQKRARLIPVAAYRGPSVLCYPRYRRLLRRPRIALVKVEGVIKLGENLRLPWAPRAAGSDTVVQELRRAREDAGIRAIVLHIDSRGGSSLASELILRAVRRAAKEKPVVAFFDSVAASGGYMAAVGATAIVAAPTCLTGSIGVFGGKFEISGLLDMLGVGRAVLRLGRRAGLESGFTPFSDEERAALDLEIDETYRDFLSMVAEGRKKKVEEIEPLAGGRVYTGLSAHRVGLVDELGGFEAAVARSADLAGIKGRPEVVSVEVPSRSLAALAGLRGLAQAWDELRSLTRERVFAIDGHWLKVDPEL
jgi:protease-4